MGVSLVKKRGNLFEKSKKKGQVTIFIIIAILILAGVVVYFVLRGSTTETKIPVVFEPIHNTFLSCIREDVSTGINVLQSQGGYIYLPDFESGSRHMPFSSQLDFLGNPIPYWYYVSGNNIPKEQVPTKREMEMQLEKFIESRTDNCDFQGYYEQDFEISMAEPVARVTIRDERVEVVLTANLNIVKGDESIIIRNYEVDVSSKLGSLYNSAIKVYGEAQNNLFLEEYAVDTLRLYAPVDGVEISCSPLIWNAADVFDELQESIEANTLALNSKSSIDEYFVVDLPVKEEVRFLNSRNWPHSFEVLPSEGALLVANPVGNQAGLGILGFCYVPYHFVYDVRYPVLVQIYSEGEIFQFPMAVVIENNNPRISLDASSVGEAVPELCKDKNTEIQVNVKDKQGRPIEAMISYECLGTGCNMGGTSSSGVLLDEFPQCVNGYVSAKAPGFLDARYLFSTVSPGKVDIIMEKLYTKNVQLLVDGVAYNGDALITFTSGSTAKTVAYPQERFVDLAEGQYEIQVYIYKGSSIKLEETITEQCIDVPRQGVLGILGLQQEQCFEIEIPEQIVSDALAGGGKQNHFILESVLISSNTVEIRAESLPLPRTIDQLQENYMLFEAKGLDIGFR